jgi:hypothetical protein
MNPTQSNSQWSGGIALQTAPKNSECKNPLEKFSPRFFGINTASFSLIIFQKPNYQRGKLLISAGANEGHFGGKMQRGPFSCTTMPGSPDTCRTEENGLPGIPMS